MTVTWLMAPLAIIQGVYAKYYGLPLTTLAAIILLARLFDTLSDPVIGYYSDRYASRTGSRKPFMFVGGLLFIVSSYFLYVPVGLSSITNNELDALNISPSISAAYFTSWFILLYLAWTLFEIPHITWGAELTKTSNEKTQIYSFRSVAGYLGILFFYAVPLLPIFETNEITPSTLKVSVTAAGLLMLPFLIICLKKTPNGFHRDTLPSAKNCHSSTARKNSQELGLLLQILIGNKPFLLFVTAYLCSNIGIGMWYGLIFIHVDTYLNLGNQFAQMFLLSYVVGIMAIPAWYKIAVVLGKHITWVLAAVLLLISFFYTGTLKPGETSFGELAFLKTVQTLGFTCLSVIAPAMLSEIADYSTWKTGIERNASYFSCFTFISKISGALATSLGLGIAGWYGLDAMASTQTKDGIFGLTLAIAWLPTASMLVALVFIVLSPINSHRHGIVQRRLDARAVRARFVEK